MLLQAENTTKDSMSSICRPLFTHLPRESQKSCMHYTTPNRQCVRTHVPLSHNILNSFCLAKTFLFNRSCYGFPLLYVRAVNDKPPAGFQRFVSVLHNPLSVLHIQQNQVNIFFVNSLSDIFLFQSNVFLLSNAFEILLRNFRRCLVDFISHDMAGSDVVSDEN